MEYINLEFEGDFMILPGSVVGRKEPHYSYRVPAHLIRYVCHDSNNTYVSWWSEGNREQIYILRIKNPSNDSLHEIHSQVTRFLVAHHGEGSAWLRMFKPAFMGPLKVCRRLSSAEALQYKETFCVVDMEGVSFYEEQDANQLLQSFGILRFSKEDLPDSVEKVEAYRGEAMEVNLFTKTVQYTVDILYKTQNEVKFMESLRKMKPVPVTIFSGTRTFQSYVDERQLTSQNQSNLSSDGEVFQPSGSSAARQSTPHYGPVPDEDLNMVSMASVIERFSCRKNANMNETLVEMWTVAETAITRMEKDGLIPASAILSGGLDPNSPDHLRRALENVQDDLLNSEYDRSASTVRGLQDEFSKSKSPVVRDYFSQTLITILRNIFMSVE